MEELEKQSLWTKKASDLTVKEQFKVAGQVSLVIMGAYAAVAAAWVGVGYGLLKYQERKAAKQARKEDLEQQ